MNQKDPSRETRETVGTEDEILAYRKSCDAEGTGLSHYVLMDKAVDPQ